MKKAQAIKLRLFTDFEFFNTATKLKKRNQTHLSLFLPVFPAVLKSFFESLCDAASNNA
jgi:hypothetical protein